VGLFPWATVFTGVGPPSCSSIDDEPWRQTTHSTTTTIDEYLGTLNRKDIPRPVKALSLLRFNLANCKYIIPHSFFLRTAAGEVLTANNYVSDYYHHHCSTLVDITLILSGTEQ
jgi:hypothetical protein